MNKCVSLKYQFFLHIYIMYFFAGFNAGLSAYPSFKKTIQKITVSAR